MHGMLAGQIHEELGPRLAAAEAVGHQAVCEVAALPAKGGEEVGGVAQHPAPRPSQVRCVQGGVLQRGGRKEVRGEQESQEVGRREVGCTLLQAHTQLAAPPACTLSSI